MSDAARMPHPPAELARYEIRLRGRFDDRWRTWFDGFQLSAGSDGTTILTGPVPDQAALHGLLRRIGDLGVTLISINATAPDHRVRPAESRAEPGEDGDSLRRLA
ncbi:hypothetical protein [Cryobacterium sp. N22]|uniref:hypothetical protein n=1 Tax=Cryobacterium sp. N22 TaxID=2048290 RepID=UPI0018ECDD05|nr:hypothetical protein [Cryobacterium sp. N22]